MVSVIREDSTDFDSYLMLIIPVQQCNIISGFYFILLCKKLRDGNFAVSRPRKCLTFLNIHEAEDLINIRIIRYEKSHIPYVV